jgi:hypothetical protein
MAATPPSPLMKSCTYSPDEREHITEVQDTAREKNDLIPFYTLFPQSFLADCRDSKQQRLVRQEPLDVQVKRRFYKITFSSPTLNLIHCTDVPSSDQDAFPQTISREEEIKETLQPSLAVRPMPIESNTELETFFDPDFKLHYFKPVPFGQVTSFVEDYQVQGGYSGLSCGRLMILKNLTKKDCPKERCDTIALTKDHRQVEYEAKMGTSNGFLLGPLTSFFNQCTEPFLTRLVKKWQANQAAACEHIMQALQDKKEQWHYDSFMIADESRLKELGYTLEEAKKMHLLALFYKKVPMLQSIQT